MWVLLWKLLANYIILKNGSTYLYLEAGFESSVTSLKINTLHFQQRTPFTRCHTTICAFL
jgi:hypothetical protein